MLGKSEFKSKLILFYKLKDDNNEILFSCSIMEKNITKY